MVVHSSFADFVLFLYIHMSHADNNYDPNEMAAIKVKMKSLFPEGTNLEKKLYQTIRQYNSFDRSKLNELFNDSFRHFSKDKEVYANKVLADMQEIIIADGSVSQSETNVLELLKRIIEITAGSK
jgi:uncharacterized tellurite resistance protein B-like protein